MTVLEQAVKALCEALVRVTGGDVAAYRRRVEAAKGLTDDQLLEQVERQIRFRRRQVQEDRSSSVPMPNGQTQKSTDE
jgi:hypothetical protein